MTNAVYTTNNGYDTITLYNVDNKLILARIILGGKDSAQIIKDFELDSKKADFSDWDYDSKAVDLAKDAEGNNLTLDVIADEIININSAAYQARKDFICR